MTPSDQNRLSLIAASKAGARLWRINVALSWVGELVRFDRATRTVVLKNARTIKSGVAGMSDALGLVPVMVTQEMVGQTLAVFCAVEDKSGQGRLTKEQEAFLLMVLANGGRAGVSRSAEDTVAIVTGAVPPQLR